MSYNNLYNYYTTQRILKRDFNYDLNEQGEMIPFERDILLTLIIQEQEKEMQKNNG